MAETTGRRPPVPTLRIAGRVQQVTQRQGQNGTLFLTLLRTPAEDEFSSPGTFELRSKRRIGSEGQMVEVDAQLIGYSRSYERKADGETVKTAEHVLQVA